MYIDWDECYSVEVPLFDEQHKILFSLINTLNISMKEGKGKEALGDVLDGLLWYTKVHFKNEEEELRLRNYEHLIEHQAEHEKLINQLLVYQNDFQSGVQVLSPQFLSFLSNWLKKHIMENDFRYRSTMKRSPDKE